MVVWILFISAQSTTLTTRPINRVFELLSLAIVATVVNWSFYRWADATYDYEFPDDYSPGSSAVKGLLFSVPILVLFAKGPLVPSFDGAPWRIRAKAGGFLLVVGLGVGLGSLDEYQGVLWHAYSD
jgi:hypothetical protein